MENITKEKLESLIKNKINEDMAYLGGYKSQDYGNKEKADINNERTFTAKGRFFNQDDVTNNLSLSPKERLEKGMLEDYWIYTQPNGKKTIIIPAIMQDGSKLTKDQLEQQYPDLFKWMMNTTEGRVHVMDFPKVANNPAQLRSGRKNPRAELIQSYFGKTPEEVQRGEFNKEYVKPTEKVMSDKEKILRSFFYPVVRSFVNEVNGHLHDCGFPILKTPEQIYKSQAEGENRYGTFSSNEITWGIHMVNYYPTIEDFINYSKKKARGKETEFEPRLTHQPRRYNPMKNWSITKRTIKKDDEYKKNPLTDKYKLEKQGYSEHDNDVVIMSELSIKGSRIGDEFEWNVQFYTKIGEKIREDRNVGDVKPDKRFISEKSGLLDNTSIYKSQVVKQTLMDALDEIKTEILSINPKEELRSRYKEKEQFNVTNKINEQYIDMIVNKIIGEIKNK